MKLEKIIKGAIWFGVVAGALYSLAQYGDQSEKAKLERDAERLEEIAYNRRN